MSPRVRFSDRSQMTSKYGKNISDTLNGSCASFAFSPHFDVICYLLLNRRTASWNLFVEQTRFKVSGWDTSSSKCKLKRIWDKSFCKKYSFKYVDVETKIVAIRFVILVYCANTKNAELLFRMKAPLSCTPLFWFNTHRSFPMVGAIAHEGREAFTAATNSSATWA